MCGCYPPTRNNHGSPARRCFGEASARQCKFYLQHRQKPTKFLGQPLRASSWVPRGATWAPVRTSLAVLTRESWHRQKSEHTAPLTMREHTDCWTTLINKALQCGDRLYSQMLTPHQLWRKKCIFNLKKWRMWSFISHSTKWGIFRFTYNLFSFMFTI